MEKSRNMKLAKLYDRVSESYELTDRFIVNSQCRTFALTQIKANLLGNDSDLRIVDLGVGDGEFLSELHPSYPSARYAGVDIADKMLELARKKLDLETFQAPLDKIDTLFPAKSFDLVIAHFVLAYVPLENILKKCLLLQRDQGLISIVTTTFESFGHSREILLADLKRRKLIGPIGRYLYQRAIAKTLVPTSFEALKKTAEKQGYEVIGRQTIIESLYFETAQELFEFGIKGGWFITAIDYPFVPYSVLNFLTKQFARLFLQFPLSDNLNIEVVLLKKT